jgi:hypothetical protein
MHGPPEKPNPTTGQDGRAEGFEKSSRRLSSKLNENYAPGIVFATAETALAAAFRDAMARKGVRP